MAQHGQPAPKLAFTNNPLRDPNMLTEEMKLLSAAQDELVKLPKNAAVNETGSESKAGAESNETPVWSKIDDRGSCSAASFAAAVDVLAAAVRETLKGQAKVASLDCEWDDHGARQFNKSAL
jgi:hypothetical protein